MRRAATVIAGVMAGGVLVTGCAQSADVVALAQAAPAKTLAADSADLAMTVVAHGMTGVPDGELLSAHGAYDFSTRTGEMTMKMPSTIGRVIGGDIQVIESGTVIYEHLPSAISSRAGLKPWIRVDLSQLGKLTGIDFAGLLEGQSSDPVQTLDQLNGIEAPVKDLGATTVDGVSVQRYSATVDLHRAASKATGARRAAIQATAKLLGLASYPVELWIDPQGRLRHLQAEIDLSHANVPVPGNPSQHEALTGSETITLDLSNFGTPVHAVAPPASQVSDISALIAAAGAAASGSTPGTARSAAENLLRQAIGDAQQAGSVHVEVLDAAPGHSATFSDYAATDGGTQQITVDGAHASVLYTNNMAYIQGDATALSTFFGLPAQAQQYAGRWISVPPGDPHFAAIVQGVTMRSMLTQITPGGSLTLAPPTTREGQSVIGITGSFGSSNVTGTLYVSVGSHPLPVAAAASASDGTRENVTLAGWGQPVPLPAPSTAVPISRLAP